MVFYAKRMTGRLVENSKRKSKRKSKYVVTKRKPAKDAMNRDWTATPTTKLSRIYLSPRT